MRRSRRVRVPPRPATTLLLTALLTALVTALTACGSQPTRLHVHPDRIQPPPQLVGRYHHYVALGDSYTAAPYVPVTDPKDPCLRSTNNYPSLIAESLRIKDFADRSCGGARTRDMTRSQQPGTPPQFRALGPHTDLVTVGIGANDKKIAQTLIGSCPALGIHHRTGAPCREAVEQHGPDLLLDAIPIVAERVGRVLRGIHRRSPDADVAVVGYPRFAPAHGTCRRLPLATGDYRYVNRVLKKLDSALRRVTERHGDVWVDLWGPSRGHDICAKHPWVNGAVTRPTRAAAYHPFEREQRAAARLTEQALAAAHG